MKFNYISLPRDIAEQLNLNRYRQHDKNGNVIVNQSDLLTAGEPDETLDEKVTRFGGALLTHEQALELIQNNKT
jgi:hypothetical protein